MLESAGVHVFATYDTWLKDNLRSEIEKKRNELMDLMQKTTMEISSAARFECYHCCSASVLALVKCVWRHAAKDEDGPAPAAASSKQSAAELATELEPVQARCREVSASIAYTVEPESVEACRADLQQEPPPVVDITKQKALAKAAQVKKGAKRKDQKVTKFIVKKHKRKHVENLAIFSNEQGRQLVQVNSALEGARDTINDCVQKLNAGTMTVQEAVTSVNALKE